MFYSGVSAQLFDSSPTFHKHKATCRLLCAFSSLCVLMWIFKLLSKSQISALLMLHAHRIFSHKCYMGKAALPQVLQSYSFSPVWTLRCVCNLDSKDFPQVSCLNTVSLYKRYFESYMGWSSLHC